MSVFPLGGNTLPPLDDPDGHRWVSPDCQGCGCCSSRLCRTAKDQGVPCSALVDGGPASGVMDVQDCPCTTSDGAPCSALCHEPGRSLALGSVACDGRCRGREGAPHAHHCGCAE